MPRSASNKKSATTRGSAYFLPLQLMLLVFSVIVTALIVFVWQHNQVVSLEQSSVNKRAVIHVQHRKNYVKIDPSNLPPLTHPNDFIIPAVQNNIVPVIFRIPTSEPVVFLTIDDGIFQEPGDVDLMVRNHARASIFIVNNYIANNPDYFKNMAEKTGSLIENHTFDHASLNILSYEQQKQDICSNADQFTEWFGRRPILFRPPYGNYNLNTAKAAAACGMQALVLWDVTVSNGELQFQVGNILQPGDIVLMHFRTTFSEDLTAFLRAAKASHLKMDLLENWLPEQ